MTASAFRPTAPLGIAVFMLSSAAVCSLILLGGFPAAPRLWVFLSIAGVGLLSVWRLTRAEALSLYLCDQMAWVILLCHPVLVARVRDLRILAQEQSLSAEIAVEIGIWAAIILYSMVRLLSDLGKLRSLWGGCSRYATLLLVAAVGSALYAASPIITLAWSVKLLAIVLLSCLMFDSGHPQASCSRFVSATFWGLAIMLAEFLILAAVSPTSALARSDVTGIWRLGGFLIPSTQLSAIAGTVALMTLVDILAGRSRRFAPAVFSASGALMLASLGRGGMMATAVAMALALAAFRRIRMAACLVLVASMILVAVPDVVDVSWQVLSRRQSEQEILSLTGRVQLWQVAIELIAEKPLLGWGYVSGGRVALLTRFGGWGAQHSHNAYLEMLLGLGLVGGTILLLLLFGTFSRLIRHLRSRWSSRQPEERTLDVLKILLLMVVLTIEGFFTSGFSGAPYFATSLLVGTAFFTDHLRLGDVKAQERAGS